MIKKRNPFIAFLFSVFPPMGQIYNGQIIKGLILYALGILIQVILLILKVPQTLPGLIILSIFGILFYLFFIIDAIINAKRQNEYDMKKYNKWYFYIAGILIILFLIAPALEYLTLNIIGTARSFYVPTGSMKPTIAVGDHLNADMSYYRSHKPQRGDILLFKPPHDPEKIHIKRCVAVEGDKVNIRNGSLFINEKKINETYTQGRTSLDMFISTATIIGKVPKNHIVVLGDNRENAQDSRYFGYIPIENVLGRALYIYYSKDKSRIGTYFNH